MLFLLFTVVSCGQSELHMELLQLDKEANVAMSRFDSEDIDSLAKLLLVKSKEVNDRNFEAKALFYLSYFRPGLPDSLVKIKLGYLDKAEEIGKELGNDTLLCRIYNQKGAWELGTMHPITAQYWFGRSIDKGRTLSDRKFTIPAEMNLSEAFRITGDTMGLKYDRDLFRYASEHNLPQARFSAAVHCAVHYSDIARDTSELQPFLEAIRSMADVYPGVDKMVLARFHMAHEDWAEAEMYISKSHPEAYADFPVLYGEILNKQGRYTESEEWLDKAIRGKDQLFPGMMMNLLSLRASNMHGLGNDSEAYHRQKRYEAFCDSLQSSRSIDLTKRYRVEYEVASKDREIYEHQMRIRNIRNASVFGGIFLLTCLVTYILWQRRRNRFYRDIVRQNRDFVERHKLLMERISRRDAQIEELKSSFPTASQPDTKESESNVENDKDSRRTLISEERMEELFEKIQSLTEKQQVWRDIDITRDKFADMVGCNRTYLTEVLKVKTGLSYSQYMNECRIREAVRVLSDPVDDTPLKTLSTRLGFLTIQTFYTSFKKEIGMSPAMYRKSVRNLD